MLKQTLEVLQKKCEEMRNEGEGRGLKGRLREEEEKATRYKKERDQAKKESKRTELPTH